MYFRAAFERFLIPLTVALVTADEDEEVFKAGGVDKEL